GVARALGGPVGGATAALLVTLSPTYLRNSRQALAEVPALAPAILAVAAALEYQRSGRRLWLVIAGVLLGVALLIKPIVLAAVVPLIGLVASPRRMLPYIGWAAASAAVLLCYAPLFPKHVVIAVPPAVALAGVGVGLGWQAVRSRQLAGAAGGFALLAP